MSDELRPPELTWESAQEESAPTVPRGTQPDSPPTAASPPEALSFLVAPSLLRRGGLHLLGGSPFAGKTTVATQILREFVAPVGFLAGLEFERISRGELGFIFTDRPWRENSQWSQAVGIDFRHYSLADDPHVKDLVRARPTSRVPGAELLAYCLDRLPGAWLIVVDVFTTSFLGHDIHDQGSVYRHMLAIHRLLEDRQVTILGTCYGSKQKQGKAERYMRPVDRIIGAASVRGSSSNLLYLETPEESNGQGYQVLTWFSRQAPDRRFALSRGPDGLFQQRLDVILESERHEEPAGQPTERRGRKPNEEHEGIILSILAPGDSMPRHALSQAAQSFGVPRPTAYRVIKRLVAEGVLILRDGDTLYRPPES